MPLANFLDARDTQKMRQYIEKRGIALKLSNILEYRGLQSQAERLESGEDLSGGNFLVLITTQTVVENAEETAKLNELLSDVDKNCVDVPSIH
jgi:hypothetical protein